MECGQAGHYHYPLYTFQHNLKSLKSIKMAKITSNMKMWVAKLDVGADESISLKSNLAIKLQLW